MFQRRGFTIIELLVVIAIIALLVSILLPAIHKARIEAWKTVSMANVHSLCQAAATYHNDNKGNLPLAPPRDIDGFFYGVPKGPQYMLWCTWSAFGKNCDASWHDRSPGAIGHSHQGWANGANRSNVYALDTIAKYRPLNPYLFTEEIPGAKAGQLQMTLSQRRSFSLAVCKDPSDRIGHQQNHGAGGDVDLQKNTTVENDAPPVSSYEDVGTSYQWTELWARQIKNAVANAPHLQYGTDGSDLLFTTGNLLFKSVARPSEMAWVNDEYAKVVMRTQDVNVRFVNGYGDINKGVVGYLDGHVRYVPVTPLGPFDSNKWLNDPMRVPAFRNQYYTAGFERQDLSRSLR